MRVLYTEEKIILSRLSQKWALSLFDLYNEESLSLAQIAQFVRIYQNKGYIFRIEHLIFKTFKGYFAIKRLSPNLYRMSDNSWKRVSADYLCKPFNWNNPFRRASFKNIK